MVKFLPVLELMPASTWQRLCPVGDLCHPVLADVERLLDQDEARTELGACEDAGRYPAELMSRLREHGMGQLFDGSATAYHINALNALVARRSGSLAITLGINGLALLPIYMAATPEQAAAVLGEVRAGTLCAMLLSEWDHGSDLLATDTRAEPGTLDASGRFAPVADPAQATHFCIRGEKRMINGATRAGILVTLARTSDAAERESVLQGAMGLSLFVVRPDHTVEPLERLRTLPVRGADIGGVRFRDTVVTRQSLIGKAGEGFSLANKALVISRGGISAFAVGAVNRAAELATEHAQRRVLYGKPIAALGAITEHLARLWALDTAVTCMSLKAAAAANALGQGAAYVCAVAKLACCELAEEAVAEGRRVMSARSLVAGPFEALMRDVLVFGIFDGTSHIMLEHLQWRLQQMVTQRPSGGSVTELRDIYARRPEPLIEVARRGGRRPWMPHVAAHLGALAALLRHPVLDATYALAGAFARVAGPLVRSERWQADQVVRHEAAARLAELEVMAATAELGAPGLRAALGVPQALVPVDPVHRAVDAAGPWRLAVAMLGARCAAGLRQLAHRADLDPGPTLAEAEGVLVHEQDRAARAIRQTLDPTTQESS